MKIFDLIKNKVVVTPEILVIPEFKAVWDLDSTKTRDTAINYFSYIYHKNNLNSPYADMDELTKDLMLKKDFIKNKKSIPKEVEICDEKYQKLLITPTSRFLEKGKQALKKFEDYFDSIDFSEVDDRGKKVYSPTELINVLKKSSEIINAMKELQKIAQLEDVQNSRMKADRKKGLFEDPD